MTSRPDIYYQDIIREELKPILGSDEEKPLVSRHRDDQRKLDVKNFSETFVKNILYLLWIYVL